MVDSKRAITLATCAGRQGIRILPLSLSSLCVLALPTLRCLTATETPRGNRPKRFRQKKKEKGNQDRPVPTARQPTGKPERFGYWPVANPTHPQRRIGQLRYFRGVWHHPKEARVEREQRRSVANGTARGSGRIPEESSGRRVAIPTASEAAQNCKFSQDLS